MKTTGKFKSKENGNVYTANGITETKKAMGVEFLCVQCVSSDGKNYLVPVKRLNNEMYFETLKN